MVRDKAGLNWKKRGTGYLPPLPNAQSEHRTATTTLIDIHYSNLRIAERWNWARYERLCSVLKVTPYELASLVCLPHSSVEKLREHGTLPGIVTGGGRAIGMLLTILEARILKKLVPDIIENPFPHLGNKIQQGQRVEQSTSSATPSHG